MNTNNQVPHFHCPLVAQNGFPKGGHSHTHEVEDVEGESLYQVIDTTKIRALKLIYFHFVLSQTC